MEEEAKKKQSFNYFLDEKTKEPNHIDYVIYYKDSSDEEIIKKRNAFKSLLDKDKQFKIFDLQDKENNYWLLSCSLERLMEQAERLKLELPLIVNSLNF